MNTRFVLELLLPHLGPTQDAVGMKGKEAECFKGRKAGSTHGLLPVTDKETDCSSVTSNPGAISDFSN